MSCRCERRPSAARPRASSVCELLGCSAALGRALAVGVGGDVGVAPGMAVAVVGD